MSEHKPALTAEEWAAWRSRNPVNGHSEWVEIEGGSACVEPGGVVISGQGTDYTPLVLSKPESRHALAAALLDGQSFGFTWADVDLLRDAGRAEDPYFDLPTCNAISDLADRIAALLPPRGDR